MEDTGRLSWGVHVGVTLGSLRVYCRVQTLPCRGGHGECRSSEPRRSCTWGGSPGGGSSWVCPGVPWTSQRCPSLSGEAGAPSQAPCPEIKTSGLGGPSCRPAAPRTCYRGSPYHCPGRPSSPASPVVTLVPRSRHRKAHSSCVILCSDSLSRSQMTGREGKPVKCFR